MMNIFWAPKSSNKNVVQLKNYNIEKIKMLEKKVWKTKKMKNKLNFLDTKKVQKDQIFWVTKNKNGTFWRKKFKKFREFFEKNKNGTF